MSHKRKVEMQKNLWMWVKVKIIKQWAKKNPVNLGMWAYFNIIGFQYGFPRMGLVGKFTGKAHV